MSKRRTRGDGALYRRASDGMWVGVVELPTVDGRRRRKVITSRTFETAAKRLRQLRKKIDEGYIPTTSHTTVAAWLPHWLETIRGPRIRPKTYAYYDRGIALILTTALGRRRLDRLTLEDVRTLHTTLQTQKSTKAAQQAHQTLQAALKDAIRNGLIARNVAADEGLPEHTQKAREPLALEAAQAIIRTALVSRDEMWATRWAAGFLTGARPAELRGLRWSYVDLDAGAIDIAWQLERLPRGHGCGDPPTCERERANWCPQATWKVRPGFEYEPCHRSLAFTRPKTRAGSRVVPLLPAMCEALRHLLMIDDINPHNLVWHHPDGRPFTREEENREWAALLSEAGVPYVAPYCARHTTATLLSQAGVDEQRRMLLLGHSSVIAHRGYTHVDRAQLDAAMRNLEPLMLTADSQYIETPCITDTDH